jgi:hypothetical protein
METIISGAAIALSVIASAVIISTAMKRFAYTLYVSIIRHSLISNFSRFGEFKEWHSAVFADESKAYFVRDGALWQCDVEGGEPIKSTARTVDLFSADVDKLKEVMAAVDAINTDAQDGDDDAIV